MAEIDPVILQLRADVGKFQMDMRNSAKLVQQSLGEQERSVQNLEAQFRKSGGAIGTTMKGLAGTLAAAFSGRELMGLIDGFTRVQNSLRVAGLEGESLAKVQRQLLDLSARYGVSLESLSNLFGNASQAGKELGASQSEIIALTEATSQSLLITGTSATTASGAILGLQQALASGTVRAEEFNQINEGGLRPLLQAAASAEKYGGSVAKLRQAVLDGKVSSQEFYRAILDGSSALESQASKATLTLSGAFESLNSQLTVYVGEAAQSNGASAALAVGIQGLANNLDLAANAIAVIATIMAGRFVAGTVAASAGLVRAQIAAATTSASFNAMTLQATRASTALTTVGVAGATAGRALLAAFGGPVGLAVTALTIGVAYLATRTTETEEAALDLAKANREASKAEQDHQKVLTDLTGKMGEGAKAARDAAKAAREKAQADLAQARAALKAAQAEREKAQAQAKTAVEAAVRTSRGAGGGTDPAMVAINAGNSQVARANAQIVEAKADIATLERRINELNTGLDPSKAAAAATEGDGKKKSKASGPTAREIEARFQNELANELQNTLSARRDLTVNATEMAALERQALALAVERYKADVQADKDYTAAQKDRLAKQADQTAALQLERINLDEREALAREQLDVMQGEIQNDRDLISAQADLASTREERRFLEYKLLDLAHEQERAELEAVIASEKSTQAQKDIAAARLAILGQLKGMQAEGIARQYESPMERRRREVADTARNMGDVIENIELDAIDRLTDGIADASTEFIKLGGIAGDVLNQIIRDIIRVQAQQLIFGGSGGVGGLLGGLFGKPNYGINNADSIASLESMFAGKLGFASGGYTGSGGRNQVAGVVHKGEYVIPADAVQRIGIANLDAIAAAKSMTGVSAASPAAARPQPVMVYVQANDYFDAKVRQEAGGVAAPMAVASGYQSSQMTEARMTRRARNRIP